MGSSSVPVLLCWRFGVTVPTAQGFPVDNQRERMAAQNIQQLHFDVAVKFFTKKPMLPVGLHLGN